MKEDCVREVENLLEECCNPNRKRRMVELFDELSDCLCQVADLAEFLRIASPDQKFSKASENACIAIATIVEK